MSARLNELNDCLFRSVLKEEADLSKIAEAANRWERSRTAIQRSDEIGKDCLAIAEYIERHSKKNVKTPQDKSQ